VDTTRRGFLKMAGLAAGAVAASGAVGAQEATGEVRWKTGLGLNGFMSSAGDYHKTYPIWEVLDFATVEGFDGIELVEGWPMGGYPGPDEAGRIASLRRLYDLYGLQVYTIQTGGAGAYVASADGRKEWLARFADTVRLCRALGCDFVGHWPGGPLAGNADVDEAIKNLASSYREAAAMCADAGMYLSFEIEPPFIFNTPEHLEKILAGANHPACKTNYDPSHFDVMWGSKGHPEEMLARIGVEHIGHVHLTDTDGTIFGGTSKHLACGDGHCDMAASLEVLWNGGYRGWIMIDGWKIEDVYDAAHKGKVAIDAAVARHGA